MSLYLAFCLKDCFLFFSLSFCGCKEIRCVSGFNHHSSCPTSSWTAVDLMSSRKGIYFSKWHWNYWTDLIYTYFPESLHFSMMLVLITSLSVKRSTDSVKHGSLSYFASMSFLGEHFHLANITSRRENSKQPFKECIFKEREPRLATQIFTTLGCGESYKPWPMLLC